MIYRNLISPSRYEEVRHNIGLRRGTFNIPDNEVESYIKHMHDKIKATSPVNVTYTDFKEIIDFSDCVDIYLKSFPEKQLSKNEDPETWRLRISEEMWKEGYSIPKVYIEKITRYNNLDILLRYFAMSNEDIWSQYKQYRDWLKQYLPNESPMTFKQFRTKIISLNTS